MQVYPGTSNSGNYSYTNAQIRQSLDRDLASCRGAATCNAQQVINFQPSQILFEDRYAQFDVRFAKGINIRKTHDPGNRRSVQRVQRPAGVGHEQPLQRHERRRMDDADLDAGRAAGQVQCPSEFLTTRRRSAFVAEAANVE